MYPVCTSPLISGKCSVSSCCGMGPVFKAGRSVRRLVRRTRGEGVGVVLSLIIGRYSSRRR